jgi:hypothetical protein
MGNMQGCAQLASDQISVVNLQVSVVYLRQQAVLLPTRWSLQLGSFPLFLVSFSLPVLLSTRGACCEALAVFLGDSQGLRHASSRSSRSPVHNCTAILS